MGVKARAARGTRCRTSDQARLLQLARRWLYEHRQIVPRERELRRMIGKAIHAHEAQLARGIVETDAGSVAKHDHRAPRERHDGTVVAVGSAGEAFLPTD